MAVSNVELYEALKGSIPKEAARMIAEVVPPAGDLARREDIARLEMRVAEIDARFDRMEAKFYRVAFMALMTQIPLWVGILGILVQMLRG